MKYLELINQTADEKTARSNKLVEKQANISLQSQILSIETEILRLEGKLATAKSAIDFNPATCYNVHNALELRKRELEYYTELQKELF